MLVETKEHYWKLREMCKNGKHKFRDNNFGVTWCLVCGQISLKTCGINLIKGEAIITNKLK